MEHWEPRSAEQRVLNAAAELVDASADLLTQWCQEGTEELFADFILRREAERQQAEWDEAARVDTQRIRDELAAAEAAKLSRAMQDLRDVKAEAREGLLGKALCEEALKRMIDRAVGTLFPGGYATLSRDAINDRYLLRVSTAGWSGQMHIDTVDMDIGGTAVIAALDKLRDLQRAYSPQLGSSQYADALRSRLQAGQPYSYWHNSLNYVISDGRAAESAYSGRTLGSLGLL